MIHFFSAVPQIIWAEMPAETAVSSKQIVPGWLPVLELVGELRAVRNEMRIPAHVTAASQILITSSPAYGREESAASPVLCHPACSGRAQAGNGRRRYR